MWLKTNVTAVGLVIRHVTPLGMRGAERWTLNAERSAELPCFAGPDSREPPAVWSIIISRPPLGQSCHEVQSPIFRRFRQSPTFEHAAL